MRISLDPDDAAALRRVAEVVRGGGVIIYPTDTVYGIGGDPLNPEAVRRIAEIKGRGVEGKGGKGGKGGKPMPILVSSIERAEGMVVVSEAARMLMRAFWPGALTLVLRVREGVTLPEGVAREGKLGIRMPDHPAALRLIEACGGALIGTSANISGERPARAAGEIDGRIERMVDLVVEGGEGAGVASTVIEILDDCGAGQSAPVRIIREGAISADSIATKLAEGAPPPRPRTEFNLVVTTQRGNERACMRELSLLASGVGARVRLRRTRYPGLLTAHVDGDPFEFLKRIGPLIEEDPWDVRFIQKIVPIMKTVRTDLACIREAVVGLAGLIPADATFKVVVNKRGGTLRSSDIIREAASAISRKVDLESPQRTVQIEAIDEIAGVSVLRDEIISVTKIQERAMEG